MSGMECSRLRDLAPELALGLLDGAERAEALAHLERCARCQADVASLTELGEQLLLLAPEVPPPAGFESRVLERVEALEGAAGTTGPSGSAPAGEAADTTTGRGRGRGLGRVRHRRPRRSDRSDRSGARRVLIGVAAAVVLAAGLVGVLIGVSGDDGPAVAATVAMETPEGNAIGTADLLEGSPPTVRIDLAEWSDQVAGWDDPPEGPWHLAVYDDSGRMESYALPDGDPTPDILLSHGDPATVHHVSVVDGEGHVWCTGEFG